MKKEKIFNLLVIGFLIFANALCAKNKETILIEAESFTEKGGWVIDQQFINEMGSPYLMAHGMGRPVVNAKTTVNVTQKGKYKVFIRTKNWAAKWSKLEAPGRYNLIVNGKKIKQTFGVSSDDWDWIDGGEINVTSTEVKLELEDLTGFNGRCDAIILTQDKNFVPANDLKELTNWRAKKLNLGTPQTKEFDFVVIGGGMGGITAAISAARLGSKVALVQNRPVLGGNNSSEVRVHMGAMIKVEPWPNLGNVVNEISPKKGGNAQPKEYYEDDVKLNAVLAEKNITLFLNHHANEVTTKNRNITSVTALNIETNERVTFKAPLYADCTGDGTIGYLAGASFMQGRESKDVFGESMAPEKSDSLTMGSSVQWFASKKESITKFPDIKWGIEMDENKAHKITKGDWDWETGIGVDQTKNFEMVRDYGMLVVYSNWSFVKNHSKEKNKFNQQALVWVAYVAGKRETRRLIGDYILKEQDLTERNVYEDGTAVTTWTIDLHYPHPDNVKKFKIPFRSVANHIKIHTYPIPYRCLYTKDVNNLLMAGRHISVSHVALGTVRLMRTIGMEGEVIGMAAALCKKHDAIPRNIYPKYWGDMEELMRKGVGNVDLPNTQTYNQGGTLTH